LYIQSMLLVHVAPVYCLHNGCWLSDKYILIVYALHVDCIKSVCWLHRQCLLIDRQFMLVLSVSHAYSNIYEPYLISCIPFSCFLLVCMMSISVLKLLPNIFSEYIFNSYTVLSCNPERT
jgi:hypothetical protein